MIFSKISVALTSAALMQSAEAHLRFTSVRGDHNPAKTGINMGHDEWFTGAIARGGDKLNRFPDQFDSIVFSNPTIPGKCCSVKYKTFPRYVMEQGCGTSLKIQDTYYRNNRYRDDQDYFNNKYYEHSQDMENFRLYNFWMSPVPYGAFAPLSIVKDQANEGKIAQATAGGWIEIDVYLVNADGGGAMKCRLDKGATGQGFGDPLKILQQPWLKSAGQTAKLKVEIPAGTACTGAFGKYKNMCLLRCENDNTAEGPFGGCVPFSLGGPDGDTVTATVTAKAPGYTGGGKGGKDSTETVTVTAGGKGGKPGKGGKGGKGSTNTETVTVTAKSSKPTNKAGGKGGKKNDDDDDGDNNGGDDNSYYKRAKARRARRVRRSEEEEE
ncbi:hypothetical protein TWF730_005909 [Orbilia blumenaviensis]|uniref:Uncharacterized protein n=1 Tax=Orbilia blumenaviensis TaxID=1796055 RepID=A0AAV9VKW6_9PEZI